MRVVLLIAISGLIPIGTASATAINTSGPGGGILNIGGLSVDVVGVPTNGCIQFYNTSYPVSNPPSGCAANAGTFGVTAPSDPSLFSPIGTTGNPIDNVPSSQAVAGFMQQNGITFDLLSLYSGGTNYCTPTTPGGPLPTSCTLPDSPFDFNILTASDIVVSFRASLCAYLSGSSPGTNCSTGTPYTATFAATFNGNYVTDSNGDTNTVSLANLIAQEATTFGITDSVAATLTPGAVPEPGTSFLLGFGLIGVGLLVRRRTQA